MTPVDEVALNFSPTGLLVLNVVLGLVMFGVALDLKVDDFRRVLSVPRAALVGLGCQFLLLPALTFGLVLLIDPRPSIALGMLLVASCPGGNLSNFLTHLARGNTALSICLSAISTACAAFLTPLNFAFWGHLVPSAGPLLQKIAISPLDLAGTIFLILGVPLAAGLWVSHRHPAFAEKARAPMRYLSIGFFVLFVGAALAANIQPFLDYVTLVMGIVFVHNGAALALGYAGARLAGLPARDRRAVSIEVGIQNSGLGLVLIFNFFGGLGGMALVAAWWGVWHIISGLTLAFFWRHRTADHGPQTADLESRTQAS